MCANQWQDRWILLEDQSQVTNSDNYVYSDIHCYGMLLYLRTGHSKKILDFVLIHQVPM